MATKPIKFLELYYTAVTQFLIIVFIRAELRALLISVPPSRARKVRSSEVEILIYAWNSREKFLIREAIISNTDPATRVNAKTYKTGKAECICETEK